MSANWLLNGLLDPTQVGQFREPRRTEIRKSLSILEEPLGIQDAEGPTPDDLVPDYTEPRITSGDILALSVFELLAPGESTDIRVQVSVGGYETLPQLGPVRLIGYTTRELELEIKKRLREAEILDDAEVQVTLIQSQSAQFSVFGSVTRAGVYPVPRPDYRLLEAVAAWGSLNPELETLYVFRQQNPARDVLNETPANEQSPDREQSRDDQSRDDQSRDRKGAVSVPLDGEGNNKNKNPAERAEESFFMSDVSPGSAAATSRADAQAVPPTTGRAGGLDEADILRGGQSTEPAEAQWRWDAGLQEWVSGPIASRRPGPSSARSEAQRSEPRPSESGQAPTTQRPRPSSARSEPQRSEPRPSESGQAPPGIWEQPEEVGSPLRIIEIPVKELIAGDPRYNIVVRSRDVINVPPGNVGEYYMMGNVARPGAYSLTGRRLTVKQAISAAGGLGPLAFPSRADLIRRVGEDEEQIIQLNLDEIFAGNAPDFYLKANDIVNVGSNPAMAFLAVLRNAFRFSYGMAFVYDRNFADADTFGAREQLRNRRRTEAQQLGLPFFN